MARTTDAKAGRLVQRQPARQPVRAAIPRAPAIVEPVTRYLREVRTELTRVDWPSRKELTSATAIVLVLLVALALFLGAADYVFTVAIRALMRQ